MGWTDFVSWKHRKNTEVDDNEVYPPFTGNQREFAAYLLYLCDTDPVLYGMMVEIGDKRAPFEQIYFYLKERDK